MVDKQRYKKDFEAARARLDELIQQRQKLDREIARLRMDMGSLAQLAGETRALASLPSLKPLMGLTASVREALRAADASDPINPLTPAEVVESVLRMGLQSPDNPNLLASVHTTLRRMAESDNPEAIECLKNAKAAYYLSDILTPEQFASHKRRKGLK